jgi:hypothetical protein
MGKERLRSLPVSRSSLRSVSCAAPLLLLCACARPSSRALARVTAESEVRTAERQRFDAMTSQDVASLDTLLDDGLTYHSGGVVQTRQQFMNTIKKQQLVYESITPSAVKVRVYDGLALVTGRSEMRVRNSAGLSSYVVRFTEVYIRRDGHWLLTAWQTKRLGS